MESIGVNAGEKKTIELCLNQHSDSEVYATKIQLLVDPKKNKSEARILIVGEHRVYVFKSGKPTHEIFLLEISEVSSPNPTSLSIKAKSGLVQLADGHTEQQIEEIISKIYFSFATTFPAIKEQLPILTIPEDRTQKIKSTVESSVNFDENCGLFTNTYTAICDHLNIVPLADLIWDINHLYVANEVTDLKLFECTLRPERLNASDIRALLTALLYNTHFTGLFVENVKLDSHAISSITSVLQHSKVLRQFVLKDASLKPEVFLGFASAFEKNPSLKITQLDWSESNVDDKTITTLAANLPAFLNGLSHLNLAGCGASTKAIVTLLKAMESHDKTCQNLTHLNLAGNKIDAEGSKALSQLFAKTPKLTELSLAAGNVDFHLLKKLESLQNLNIAGNKIVNKDAKHMDMLRFLQLAPNLTKLNVSSTNFPPDMFTAFFESVPRLEILDLSDNNLGDAGLTGLVEVLTSTPNNVQNLLLDRNFDKPSKTRPKAIQSFSQYLSSDACKLTSLSIQGSAKGGQLKADLVPIAFALLTNKSLKKVDVTGNLAGNGLALAINKFLQINDILEELYIDENSLSMFSLQLIKAGLSRNTTLRTLPTPAIDSSVLLKDNLKAALEILTEIQGLLNTNRQTPAESSPRTSNITVEVTSPRNATPAVRDQRPSVANTNEAKLAPTPTPASVASPAPSASSAPATTPAPSATAPAPSTATPSTPHTPITSTPSSGSGLGVRPPSRERSTSSADKPVPPPKPHLPQPTQEKAPQPPPKQKKHMKVKPSGLDTQRVSALFTQLSDVIQSSPDLTPEEIEHMQKIAAAAKEQDKQKEAAKQEAAKQEAPKK